MKNMRLYASKAGLIYCLSLIKLNGNGKQYK